VGRLDVLGRLAELARDEPPDHLLVLRLHQLADHLLQVGGVELVCIARLRTRDDVAADEQVRDVVGVGET
jgi:hypothetical protein